MSEEEGYIIITIEDNGDSTNDTKVVIIQDSETELPENMFSTDGTLTTQPDFQGSNGVDGLPVPGDQAVSQMSHLATLKRHSSNSLEVEFLLSHKRRSSYPRGDYSEQFNKFWQICIPPPTTRHQEEHFHHPRKFPHASTHQSNASESFSDENHQNQLMELQHHCEGAAGPSVPEDQQETQPLTNSVGAPLQSAASPELQHPDLRQKPPIPEVVPTFSLQSNRTPGGPAPGLAALSYFVSEGAEGASCVTLSAQCPPAVPPALLPQGKPSLVQFPEAANCSTLPGNSSMDPHAASSAFCIPPSFEMPGKAEASLGDSAKSVYYPTLLRHDSGQDTASSSVFILPNFEIPETAETSLENNPKTMNHPSSSGNDRDQCSSLVFLPPNFAIEKFILLEMSGNADTSPENSSETIYYPALLGSIRGSDTDSSSLPLLPNFEMMGKEETSLENNTKMTNCPPVLENDSGQDTSAYFFIPSSFALERWYLGDPKRNVRVLDAHLLTAQRKANPRHAVRYLIHILFSKEILTDGWVGVNSQGLRPLDANKMAALREHLQSVFPDYDLREYGNYWQTCIADINSLISCLRSEANTIRQKAGDNSKGPTNPDTPVAADLNGTRYGKGSESSSQLSQQAAASETRGNGNSQQNSSACPKGIKEHSTDNSLVSYEALEYLGNPDRNIQLPHSVLSMAKVKSRPELSAIYLIRNLFTEEVLIRSNIYGSLGHGLYALNPNRINALREFLGDAYPTCDLSESGYDWKLCVTAINSCIRSLRCDFKKSTSKA
ncbi:BEN domain-containing protein 2 [Prionailurus iriomotensis]